MWRLPARLRYVYFAHLSKPATQRCLYRLIRKHRVRRIVEFGLGNADRAARMIEVAAATVGAHEVTYSGIDPFEMRAPQDGVGISLKLAHRKLVALGARIRLVPGDPYVALSRAPNMLGVADLIVISADQDADSLTRAWFFIDRLLHEKTLVMQELPGGDAAGALRSVPREEIRQLAAAAAAGRRRAA